MSADDDSAPDLPYLSDDKPCLICADKSDGTHFGVDACRACAAFFRRTVVSGRKYYCQAYENCEVNKNARCMCRSCRFRKCFAVGMRQDMVQGRRDPIIPKVKKDGNTVSAVSPPTPKKIVPTTVAASFRPQRIEIAKPTLLYDIMRNYKKLREERRSIELTMDPTIPLRFNKSGPLKGYTLGSSTKLSKFNKAHAPLMLEFASASFPEFARLSKGDQNLLFSAFLALSWGTDHCYHTYMKVPREMYETISIVSETTYFDFNQCETWLGELTCSPQLVLADIIKTIKDARTKAKLKQLFIMSDMKIEEEEYAALIGLMLWNQNFESGSDEMDALVKQMRENIFDQLEIFYKSSGRHSYARRLGELMGLHGTILVDAVRFREDMEVFNLLQAVEKDDLLYESMRNSKNL